MDKLSSKNYLGKKALVFGLSAVIMIFMASMARAQTQIDNPIAATSFEELVKAITAAIRRIAIVFAPVAFVFVGIRFVTASGNEKKLGEAKKMFWWVTVGTAIAVGASLLADAAVNFAKNLQ